jgi:hypothetical protein
MLTFHAAIEQAKTAVRADGKPRLVVNHGARGFQVWHRVPHGQGGMLILPLGDSIPEGVNPGIVERVTI